MLRRATALAVACLAFRDTVPKICERSVPRAACQNSAHARRVTWFRQRPLGGLNHGSCGDAELAEQRGVVGRYRELLDEDDFPASRKNRCHGCATSASTATPALTDVGEPRRRGARRPGRRPTHARHRYHWVVTPCARSACLADLAEAPGRASAATSGSPGSRCRWIESPSRAARLRPSSARAPFDLSSSHQRQCIPRLIHLWVAIQNRFQVGERRLEAGEIDIAFARPPVDSLAVEVAVIDGHEVVIAVPEGLPLAACDRLTREQIADEPSCSCRAPTVADRSTRSAPRSGPAVHPVWYGRMLTTSSCSRPSRPGWDSLQCLNCVPKKLRTCGVLRRLSPNPFQ